MDDKRQYTRVACEIDSAYQNLDATHAEAHAETITSDLSEGGVRFRAGRFISVHNRLLFRLRIPGQKPIEALAQPAWVREIPSVSQYEIGAKFLSLSDEDRELIRRYVQNF